MKKQYSGIPVPPRDRGSVQSRHVHASYTPQVQSKLRHELPPPDFASERNKALTLMNSTNSTLLKSRTNRQCSTSPTILSGNQSSLSPRSTGERRRSTPNPRNRHVPVGNLLKHTLKAEANKENHSSSPSGNKPQKLPGGPKRDHSLRPKLPKPLPPDSTLLRRARTHQEFTNDLMQDSKNSDGRATTTCGAIPMPKAVTPLLIRKRRNTHRASICSSDIFTESGSYQTLPSQVLVHTPLSKACDERRNPELSHMPSNSSSIDLKTNLHANDNLDVQVKSTWTMMDEIQLIRDGGLTSQARFTLVPQADLRSVPLCRKRYTGLRWRFSLGSRFGSSSSLATFASNAPSSHAKTPGAKSSIRSFSVPILNTTPRHLVSTVHGDRDADSDLHDSPSSETCQEASETISIHVEMDGGPLVKATLERMDSPIFDSTEGNNKDEHTSTTSPVISPREPSLSTNSSFFFLPSRSQQISNTKSTSFPILPNTRTAATTFFSSPQASSIEIVNHTTSDIHLLDRCQIALSPSRKIFELPPAEHSGNYRGAGLNAGMSYAKQVVKMVRSKTASFRSFALLSMNGRRD